MTQVGGHVTPREVQTLQMTFITGMLGTDKESEQTSGYVQTRMITILMRVKTDAD